MRNEKEQYNRLHKIWDSAHVSGSPTYLIREKIIKKELIRIFNNLGRKVSVLDIGCGTGGYIDFFEKYSSNYTGLDLSDYAIKRLKKEYPKKKFICGNIHNLKIKKKFDVIFLSEVLEHIDDEERLLKRINNLLLPSGILVLSVPFDPKLWSYSDVQARHRRRYTKKYLKKILMKTSFKDIHLICYGFPLLRAYWMITKGFRKNIQSSKNGSKRIFTVLNRIFFIDLLFTRTNLGVGLVAICKK